jgi:hypothetical protein
MPPARALSILAFAALLPVSAAAQPSRTEQVIVTAPKQVPPEIITRFIENFAAPTTVLGKLSRWERPICPVAVGLRPEAIRFILQRLRDNARKAGAPVNDKANCRANIEIVFTTTPQALLDNVRAKHVRYLGYASSGAQEERLARVLYPIQAWYTTANVDLNGFEKVDDSRTIGLGDAGEFAASLMMGNVTGLRMRDGRKSTLYHVIIAIDPARLLDHEMGGIADYISMLALSQMTSLNQCQPLASIINMLASDCAATAGEMTESDFAFLRGLYKMTLDGDLRMQKDGIRREMAEAFKGEPAAP